MFEPLYLVPFNTNMWSVTKSKPRWRELFIFYNLSPCTLIALGLTKIGNCHVKWWTALHCYDKGDQAESMTTSLLILYCHHWRLFFEASYKALNLVIFITEIWGSFIIIIIGFIVIGPKIWAVSGPRRVWQLIPQSSQIRSLQASISLGVRLGT